MARACCGTPGRRNGAACRRCRPRAPRAGATCWRGASSRPNARSAPTRSCRGRPMGWRSASSPARPTGRPCSSTAPAWCARAGAGAGRAWAAARTASPRTGACPPCGRPSSSSSPSRSARQATRPLRPPPWPRASPACRPSGCCPRTRSTWRTCAATSSPPASSSTRRRCPPSSSTRQSARRPRWRRSTSPSAGACACSCRCRRRCSSRAC